MAPCPQELWFLNLELLSHPVLIFRQAGSPTSSSGQQLGSRWWHICPLLSLLFTFRQLALSGLALLVDRAVLGLPHFPSWIVPKDSFFCLFFRQDLRIQLRLAILLRARITGALPPCLAGLT